MNASDLVCYWEEVGHGGSVPDRRVRNPIARE
jgi:hypothetical protein